MRIIAKVTTNYNLPLHCLQQVEAKHILVISDSSEINLQSHVGRLKPEGIGVVGNNTDVGFYIHPSLVLDSGRRV
jgi:hypothetical protein